MKDSSTVKITSKHQLTLPARIVRELQLSTGDFLQYELRDNSIILKPRPTLRQHLETIWSVNAKSNKGIASDVSIKQTLRDYHHSKKV